MPLHLTIHPDSQTTVKIWKITESYNTLFKTIELQQGHLKRVKDMKSELHQRGFLSVRHLLKTFGYTDFDLYYDDLGKPHLKDGRHISITHSFHFSGVIISDQPVGIDIEMQREKIKRIARKFVDYEKDYLIENQLYVRELSVIWCIKEALYKLFSTPGLSFRDHLLVIPFSLDDKETLSWIDYKEKKYRHPAYFLEFEEFTCAYVLS